jgi:hypothetical protein
VTQGSILLLWRQIAVQRQDGQIVRSGQRSKMPSRLANLVQARREDKDVAIRSR